MAPINLPDGSQVSEIVLPDGSTASEVLAPDGSTVFSTIPDEVDNRFKMDEGSGTTLSDSRGSLSATFQGDWVTDPKYTGGAATSYARTDGDFWTADSNIDINGQEWGVGFWLSDLDNSGGFGGVVSAYPEGGEPSDGWTLFAGDVNGSSSATDHLTVQHVNGGSISTAVDTSTPDLADGDDYFIALSGDGDTTNLYLWDGAGQQVNTSGTASRGQTADAPLTGMDRNNNHCGGIQDDVFVAQGAAPTESEWQTIYQLTKR